MYSEFARILCNFNNFILICQEYDKNQAHKKERDGVIDSGDNKNYPSHYLVPSLTTKLSHLFENVNKKESGISYTDTPDKFVCFWS